MPRFEEPEKVPPGPWSPTLIRGRPRHEDQSNNGVRVIVHRNENGTWVDAQCGCMGSRLRMHTSMDCPLLAQLQRERRGGTIGGSNN